MTIEDQVAAKFARANPVPSLNLLDPIELVDIDRLTEQSERSRAMTDVKAKEASNWNQTRRSRLIPVVVAVGAVALVLPFLLVGVATTGKDSPVGVATSYMAALAAHDWEGAEPLFSPDFEDLLLSDPQEMTYLESWEFDQAVGWTYVNQGCAETSTGSGGTLVDCQFLLDNDWSRALGLRPGHGQIRLLIDGGMIRGLTEQPTDSGDLQNAEDAFIAWLEANHPNDMGSMLEPVDGDPLLDPESIALWEQYTDEFVAEVEASG